MKTLLGVALFAVTAAGAGSVFAQTYPDRPVTLHVGFAPGGPADTLARLIGQQLSETLGQPVVVENAPGAGGSIAAREVAAADPSGYDLLFVTSGHAGNFTYYPNLEFAPEDLTAVAGVAQTPIVLTVAPDSEFSSLEDLIAAAEAAPGDLVYAAGGGGATLTALAAESFLREAGIEALAVSYPGSGPQNVDLMGGMLDFAFDTVSVPRHSSRVGKSKLSRSHQPSPRRFSRTCPQLLPRALTNSSLSSVGSAFSRLLAPIPSWWRLSTMPLKRH